MLVAGVTATVGADTVWLRDGSVMSGTVISLEDRVLQLDTEYAGRVKLKWGHVKALSTTHPLWLRMQDSRRECKVTLLSDGSALWLMTGRDELKPLDRRQVVWLGDAPVLSQDSWEFNGFARLYLDLDRGTDSSDTLNTKGHIELNRKPYRNTVSWSSKRREKNNAIQDDKWLLKYDYNYLVSDSWYGIGNTSIEHNSDKDLKRRTTIGGGFGRQFIHVPDYSLRLELGLSQLWEVFEFKNKENCNSSQAFHWALKSWKPLFEEFEFSHDQDFFKRFGGNKGWLLQTETGLKWRFSNHFSFNVTVDYDYDTAPPSGNSNEEKSLNFGVGYEW
ncbi:DUF481 domain-containing protein [Endozoicomonadaceae bacterium StTr2]